MAKVTLSPLITGIKGRLGDMVFRVSQSGETFVTRSPDMSAVVWSRAQQDYLLRLSANALPTSNSAGVYWQTVILGVAAQLRVYFTFPTGAT